MKKTNNKTVQKGKKLLRITIYENINSQYEVELLGQTIYTINQNDLYGVIKEVIKTRLQVQHDKMLALMKEAGAIKSTKTGE